MMTDARGRGFDPLIHETNGDGTPKLTTRGKIRCKRGDQGRRAEAEYAARLASGAAVDHVVAQPAPKKEGEDDADADAADPAPVGTGDPVDTGPAAGSDLGGMADSEDGDWVDIADVRLPGEGVKPDDTGGQSGVILGLVLITTFLFIRLWLGPRWGTTAAEDRALGLSSVTGRLGALLGWVRSRLCDPEAMKALRARLSGVRQAVAGKDDDDG